eukprot:1387755-Amorphochlora_amoeboformis.AAC.2
MGGRKAMVANNTISLVFGDGRLKVQRRSLLPYLLPGDGKTPSWGGKPSLGPRTFVPGPTKGGPLPPPSDYSGPGTDFFP